MISIYVLKCSNDKYYVGKTKNDINTRFLQHVSGENNCAFTSKYSPIEIIENYSSSDPLDEDKTTKKYMMKYGIENVRGGSYTKLELEKWQIQSLEHEFISVSDLCFKCKKSGHFALDCDYNEELDLYLKSFDTLEKIDPEINKIKSKYIYLSTLKKQIDDTVIFSVENLPHIKKLQDICKKRAELMKTNPGSPINYQESFNKIQEISRNIQKQLPPSNRNFHIINYIGEIHDKIFTSMNSTIKFLDVNSLYTNVTQRETELASNDHYIKFLEIVNYNIDKRLEYSRAIKNSCDLTYITSLLEKLYVKRLELLNYS